MTTETIKALQGLCASLSSLAANLSTFADTDILKRLVSDCRQLHSALNDEDISPETIKPPLPRSDT